MIQKKVCTLGAYAVGKTSLLARFVHSRFSETYLTTIGVKIDKKIVRVEADDVTLMLWDLAGEDEFLQVRASFLRGAAGYLLVVDRTRPATLVTALNLKARIEREVGEMPFVVVFNKSDLAAEAKIARREIEDLTARGVLCVETSAKTGVGVEELFLTLTREMLARDRQHDSA